MILCLLKLLTFEAEKIMNLSKWIYIFASAYTSVVSSGKVDQAYIKDNTPAVKGSSVQIVCEAAILRLFGFVKLYKVVKIYKVDSIPDNIRGLSTLAVCNFKRCNGTYGRYKFHFANGTLRITILDLKRSEDQKWWICASGDQMKQIHLTVYTPPEGITLDTNIGGDLQEDDVNLTCRSSNCLYPAPQAFQWYYQDITETGAPWLFYQNTTPSVSTSSCNDSEKRYSSTLKLPRFTTWPLQPLNTEQSVKFQCRMSFPTLKSQLQSDPSEGVKFAVHVSSVTLKDGNSTPSESLDVIGGNAKTLTCETSISRPISTIVWYIGATETERSSYNSTFTYVPKNNDDGKQLYCKAFNTQPEDQAVSSKKITLNVLDTTIDQTFYIEGYYGQDNVTVDKHDTKILFKCIVNTIPKFDIKIMFEGNVLVEQVNKSSLSFVRRLRPCFDAGVYTCEGTNMFGRISTRNITLQFSDQQQTASETRRQSFDKTALIVEVVLGAVCFIVIMYAIYVTITKNRLLRQATSQLENTDKRANQSNATRAQDVTNTERYDNICNTSSEEHYIELSQYAFADTNTYDMIKKI